MQGSEEGLRVSPRGQFYLAEQMVVPLLHRFHPADCPFYEVSMPKEYCDQYLSTCGNLADNRYHHCVQKRQEVSTGLSICGILTGFCALKPNPLSIFCSLVSVGCSAAGLFLPDCEAILTREIGNCAMCYQVCVQYSRRTFIGVGASGVSFR